MAARAFRHYAARLTWLPAIAACMAAVALFAPAPAPGMDQPFITARGGRFWNGTREYRAMGFTAYELCIGKDAPRNTRDKVLRIFKCARDNGFTLYRATTIIDNFKVGDLSQHLSERVWRQMDLILDVARSLDMRVIIDFSTMTYDTGKHSDPPFDVTAEQNFHRIEAIYDVVPRRKNTINGRVYAKDATIMAYSILGEIVPYGLNKRADGSLDLKNESRSADNYVEFVARAAARLKRNAPRTLVNAGGLLHVSPTGPVKDRSGRPYWQTLWSDSSVDFGSIHIYAKPPKALPRPVTPPYQEPMPWGEWKNLGVYTTFCKGMGKPFVVEEWGIDASARGKATSNGEAPSLEMSLEAVRDYVTTAYACVREAQVPISILWQWSPGGAFNLWPGESADEDSVVAIIRKQTAYFNRR